MKLRDFMISVEKVRTAIEQSAKECFSLGEWADKPSIVVNMNNVLQMEDVEGNYETSVQNANHLGSIAVILKGNGAQVTLNGLKCFLEVMDVQPPKLAVPTDVYHESMVLEDGKGEVPEVPYVKFFLDAERLFEKFG